MNNPTATNTVIARVRQRESSDGASELEKGLICPPNGVVPVDDVCAAVEVLAKESVKLGTGAVG